MKMRCLPILCLFLTFRESFGFLGVGICDKLHLHSSRAAQGVESAGKFSSPVVCQQSKVGHDSDRPTVRDMLAVTRRNALGLASGVILGGLWNRDSTAYAEGAEPTVTSKAFFDIKITGRTKALENEKWEKIIARDKRAGGAGTGDQVLRVVFGLYGKDAPETVAAFEALAGGGLAAPCVEEDEVVDSEAFGVSERSKLTRRQIYRQCKAAETATVGYQYSQVYRVVKGKFTGLGRLNKLYRQPPRNNDANAIKHDTEGLLSAPKGGGEFEFLVTAGAVPELDGGRVVFGRVLEGQEIMRALNAAPVTQGQFLEGAFKLTGKAIGDVRAQVATKERPLQKMSVIQCGLL